MENFVTVYQYTSWDEAAQARVASRAYATLELIRSGLGQPIHASAIKVPLAELDNGLYQPAAEASPSPSETPEPS